MSISSPQIELVKATVPALQAHGESITRAFYRSMFAAHPELLNIFNPAHQATGEQARSLAASVLAYAAHIDEPHKLSGMVERIAHKHVSLEVLPEHYPIVGKHLLGAIKEVLGEAATPEILQAWEAAYGVLADILIAVEGDMYTRDATAEGGWEGFKPFVISEKTPQGAEIASFVLRPQDGAKLPPHRAGQYLSLRFVLPERGLVQMRQYSIASLPNGEHYRIAVKREEGGLISNLLHETLNVGDSVEVHMPAGDFTLKEGDRPLLLLAAGVGISPLLPLAERALRAGRAVHLVQAVRSDAVRAFADELADLQRQHEKFQLTVFNEDAREKSHLRGRVEAASLQAALKRPLADHDVYFCGPAGFSAAIEGLLNAAGVPRGQRFSETFGPSQSFEDVLQS